jgi:hypothetical protein
LWCLQVLVSTRGSVCLGAVSRRCLAREFRLLALRKTVTDLCPQAQWPPINEIRCPCTRRSLRLRKVPALRLPVAREDACDAEVDDKPLPRSLVAVAGQSSDGDVSESIRSSLVEDLRQPPGSRKTWSGVVNETRSDGHWYRNPPVVVPAVATLLAGIAAALIGWHPWAPGSSPPAASNQPHCLHPRVFGKLYSTVGHHSPRWGRAGY